MYVAERATKLPRPGNVFAVVHAKLLWTGRFSDQYAALLGDARATQIKNPVEHRKDARRGRNREEASFPGEGIKKIRQLPFHKSWCPGRHWPGRLVPLTMIPI